MIAGHRGTGSLVQVAPAWVWRRKTRSRRLPIRRIRAEFSALGDEGAEVIVRRCAAYEGAKRAALPRADQACVACNTLWNVWLETLLPGFQAEVEYPMRRGKGDSICRLILHIRARGGAGPGLH